jgi:hypothetical protein
MTSTTIRISEKTHAVLRDLAAAEGKPMAELVAQAIEKYRRERFLAEVNAAYAALRANPQASAEFDEELRLWDATLMDGLEDEEWEDSE